MPAVVIWGPPCAGKSTYIRERAQYGDIIVDLDRIALALMPEGSDHHDYPEHVRECARAARWAIVDDAARWGRYSEHTAWIIDSNASRAGRNRWRAEGAEVVELRTPRHVCEERAMRERPDKVLGYIADWFAQHGE